MNRAIILKHEFVETIPATVQEGTIYVCIPYATAVHKCCCGCGNEIVTPITPMDWQLTYDGETISLHPSIGSWNLPCQSHYFIRRNTVQWARRWTRDEIAAGRAHERHAKDEHFTPTTPTKDERAATPKDAKSNRGLWRKLKKRFS